MDILEPVIFRRGSFISNHFLCLKFDDFENCNYQSLDFNLKKKISLPTIYLTFCHAYMIGRKYVAFSA